MIRALLFLLRIKSLLVEKSTENLQQTDARSWITIQNNSERQFLRLLSTSFTVQSENSIFLLPNPITTNCNYSNRAPTNIKYLRQNAIEHESDYITNSIDIRTNPYIIRHQTRKWRTLSIIRSQTEHDQNTFDRTHTMHRQHQHIIKPNIIKSKTQTSVFYYTIPSGSVSQHSMRWDYNITERNSLATQQPLTTLTRVSRTLCHC